MIEQQDQADLEDRAPQDQGIAEKPRGRERPIGTTTQEHVHDLHHDDGAQARGGGSQVQWILRPQALGVCPSAPVEHEEKRGHGGHGLDHSEKEVGPPREGPVEEPLVPGSRRTAHHLRIGLFDA
jgi:hypothetical protein